MNTIQQDKEKKDDSTTPIIYESIRDKNTMSSKVIPPPKFNAVEFFTAILLIIALTLIFVVTPILFILAYSDF